MPKHLKKSLKIPVNMFSYFKIPLYPFNPIKIFKPLKIPVNSL